MLDEPGKDALDGVLEDMAECGIFDVDAVIELFHERGLEIVKKEPTNAKD